MLKKYIILGGKKAVHAKSGCGRGRESFMGGGGVTPNYWPKSSCSKQNAMQCRTSEMVAAKYDFHRLGDDST